MKNCSIIFGLLSIFALTSCVSRKTKAINDHIMTLKDSYCKAPYSYQYDKIYHNFDSDSLLSNNKELKKTLSDQSILILHALNSLEDVEEIIKLKKDSTQDSQARIMMIKDKIDGKITLALSEVDAVAAEFDCEGERVGQMANYVTSLNNKRDNKLVVYSIAVGALATVAAGIIKNDDWGSAVDIGGGVLGAAFGFALLNPKSKKIEFLHQRNLLRDIWTEKLQSKNFPPFIWYMYNEKKFSNLEKQSIIQNMKTRWITYQFDGSKEDAEKSPIFKDGGIYDADALQNREAMLDQMQSATRTINQTINYLLIDLNRLSR